MLIFYLIILINFAAKHKRLRKIFTLHEHSAKECPYAFFYPLHKKTLGLVFLLILLSYVKTYSQESQIHGLENIHISEGASVVIQNSENKITIITSSSVKSYAKKDSLSKKEHPVAQRKALETKKEIRDKEKNIKKLQQSAKPDIVYNNQNSSSNSELSNSTGLVKKGINTHNSNQFTFIDPSNYWLHSVICYQRKVNTSYKIYLSRKEYNSLFARPPPIPA